MEMVRVSRDAVPLITPRRVLVKEVNWLGDVVMSLPALRALRHAFPQARLSVLVKKELASFFDGSAWIDEVIPYSIGRGAAGIADQRRLIRRLRASDIDLAIVFPRSFSSALWAVLGRARQRVGFASDARGLLLTHKTSRPPELLARHQVHDYLHLLRETLAVEGSAEEYQPDVHAPHRERMRDWLAARRRRPRARLIALAVAAAYGPAKEWPAARYAALIDLLAAGNGAECVLVGAPGERRRCEEVAAASRDGALIAAGETGIGEAMALLSLCDGFAGNDSGSMHVAGALGVPTVGIFGSTRPERTAPLGPRTKVLYHRIECSPCLERTCRYGHYECLHRIAVEEVARALADLCALG
jgi:heptosyltransferase-2